MIETPPEIETKPASVRQPTDYGEAKPADALRSYGEAKEKPPILETAEQEFAKMNEEMGEFLSELETAEKNIDDEKLREQIKDLRKEAMFSADWWAGNILAFTDLVVGDSINFPALEKIKEANKQETFEEMKERAKKELAETGITREQLATYKFGINDAIEKGITPEAYNLFCRVIAFPSALIIGHNFRELPEEGQKHREDAWRLYLGISQKNDTFEISDYQPNNETEPERVLKEEYCYKIKGFWREYLSYDDSAEGITLVAISNTVGEIKRCGGVLKRDDHYKEVMGNFSFSLGKDEKGSYIAYSDIWDLAVFPENEKGFFGKPFHIYDRLYYDPETYEPLLR
jgi:hypothetical protein